MPRGNTRNTGADTARKGGSRGATAAVSRPRASGENGARHEHRTAKVVELVSTSTRSFEDAIKNGIADAAETTRGITGAHVQNMSVTCMDGEIVEYKVNMNIAFGVERT